jgi:hypothetical protein
MTDPSAKPKRNWLVRLLIVFGILMLAGIAASVGMFFAWTDWVTATAEEASAALAAARAAIGEGLPYIEIRSEREIVIHRELEPEAPAPLAALRVLVWVADDSKLVRVKLPSWFLSAKASMSFGLDSFTRELSSDLSGYPSLTLDDLKKRGPGLYVDYAFPDGHILLWGDGKSGD